MAKGGGIKRFIELVLDAASAKRMRDAAQRALDVGTDPKKARRNLNAAEAAMDRIRGAAVKLGAAVVAAFAVDRIARFGASAVQAAVAAEAGWSKLGNTLRNVGTDLDSQRERIQGVAEAIAAYTVFDDDAVVSGLQRMVSLTGDYEGSLARVGLVADLASDQQISFDEAAEAIGKTMNGSTRELKKYGLEALGAEAGLAALAGRLQGTAANEALTFTGQLKQLNNEWGEFKEAVGRAVVAGGDGASTMGTLRGVVRSLTGAVDENEEGFSSFIKNGLRVGVFVLESVINGFRLLSQVLGGGIMLAIGKFVTGWSRIVDVFALAVEARAAWNRLTGDEAQARQFEAEARQLRTRAEILRGVAAAYREGARAAANFERISLSGSGGPTAAGGVPDARNAPGLRPGPGEDAEGGRSGGRAGRSGRTAVSGNRAANLGPTPIVAAMDLDVLSAASTKSAAEAARDAIAFEAAYLEERETHWLDSNAMIIDGALTAADGVTAAWRDAFAILFQEGANLQDFMGALTGGLAQAMISGLAEYAGSKQKQEIAEGIGMLAKGFGFAALGNVPSAAIAKKAALTHFLSAAAWGALSGAAGAAGSAAGGGGGGGYRPDGRSSVDKGNRSPEIHLYQRIDGINPRDPRHQEGVYATMGNATERFGEGARVNIIVHPYTGGGIGAGPAGMNG